MSSQNILRSNTKYKGNTTNMDSSYRSNSRNTSDQSSMALSASQMINTQYEEIIAQQKDEINKLTGEIIDLKNELQNQGEQAQEEISELRDILRRLEMENRDMKMLIGKQYGLHHPTTEPNTTRETKVVHGFRKPCIKTLYINSIDISEAPVE